ncbi:MAG TPA: lytic transglycosylase domain-containing protein, partial [Acidimicrobiales bacterium]|nr:lytic transglycosylase domain-containing protein [Acidimicrobiales bacterium]
AQPTRPVPRSARSAHRAPQGGPSEITRLLNAAAAARAQLGVQVAEAEAALAQREAEHAAAEADVRVLEATEADLRSAVTMARSRLGQIEATIPGLAAAWDAAAAAASEKTTRVGYPLARGRAPKDDAVRAWSALVDATGMRDEAVEALRVGELDLELAGTRVADGRQAAASAAEELEQRRHALDGLRRQLEAAGSAATTGGFATRSLTTEGSDPPTPSALALSDVPPEYLDLYRLHAARCPGLSWTVLAAIGFIESSHGRSAAPGVHAGANFAGAMGPMQFLGPTWDAYGVDGNEDGARDVYQPSDAVAGAANYLCASGAGRLATLAGAIWDYNHADWYVAAVIQLAAAYGGTAFAEPGPPATVAQLLANPNLTLSPGARADLVAGRADPRLTELLGVLAAHHRITVSVIKTGHSQFVAGTTRVSNHFDGRGVDISEVDGAPVDTSNAMALELSLAILTTDSAMRPDEFGSPWPELSRFPGGFSDDDHADHLHLGWTAASQAPTATAR